MEQERRNDEIVIAALDRDEIDVDMQGPDHPPVGADLTLVRGEVRTQWKVLAVRTGDGEKVTLTCRRIKSDSDQDVTP